MSPKALLAYELLTPHLPSGSQITITETDGINIKPYLIHVTYISRRTGKQVGKTLRCDTLPTQVDDIRFYTSALVLSPNEVARSFSEIAWREKRARQESWLSGGKLRNDRVATEDYKENYMPGETFGEMY